MVKTFKYLLQKKMTNGREDRFVALGTQVKWWSGVDLHLFTARSNMEIKTLEPKISLKVLEICTWRFISTKGQGHSLTFVLRSSYLDSFKSLGKFKAISHKASRGGGNRKCSNGPGHMTDMATMPIYGKGHKNFLLQTQLTDDFEPRYVALGTGVLSRLFKTWPWVDFYLFYGKVKYRIMLEIDFMERFGDFGPKTGI